jgi:hypothetical protein
MVFLVADGERYDNVYLTERQRGDGSTEDPSMTEMTDFTELFAGFNTRDLQAAAFLITGLPVRRNESRANAEHRVVRAMQQEKDARLTLDNLPSLLKSRNHIEAAASLKEALDKMASEQAKPVEIKVSEEEIVDLDGVILAAQAASAAQLDNTQTQEPKAPKLPRPGTKSRMVFDMLCRPHGATNDELFKATGINGGWAVDARRYADRLGMAFVKEGAGKGVRLILRQP